MKNILVVSVVVMSVVRSNLYAGELKVALIFRDIALTSEYKAPCAADICSRINFDRVEPQFADIKTARVACRDHKEISFDPV